MSKDPQFSNSPASAPRCRDSDFSAAPRVDKKQQEGVRLRRAAGTIPEHDPAIRQADTFRNEPLVPAHVPCNDMVTPSREPSSSQAPRQRANAVPRPGSPSTTRGPSSASTGTPQPRGAPATSAALAPASGPGLEQPHDNSTNPHCPPTASTAAACLIDAQACYGGRTSSRHQLHPDDFDELAGRRRLPCTGTPSASLGTEPLEQTAVPRPAGCRSEAKSSPDLVSITSNRPSVSPVPVLPSAHSHLFAEPARTPFRIPRLVDAP